MSVKTILHFPKWFPNRFDPQNGIFIKKQIESVQESCNQIVLCVYKDEEISKRVVLEERLEGSIRYIDIKFRSFQIKVLNVIYQLFLGFRYGWFYSRKCDVVHAHIMGRTLFLAWVISALRNKPLVHTEHWSLFLNESLWNSKGKFYQVLTRFLFSRCNRIFAVSLLLKEKIKAIKLELKIDILSNVISENPFFGITKRKPFTFIHVSDLRDDLKNISDIIRVFKSLEIEKFSDVKLLIIGDGKDREMLKKLADNSTNIDFAGRLNNTEVYKALNTVHALILNSRTETFGMVVPEAFACGIPVICAKNGVTDLFVDDRTGIVINQESPAELEQAIIRMVKNYSQYIPSEIIKKSKPFSKEGVGECLQNTYNALTDEN